VTLTALLDPRNVPGRSGNAHRDAAKQLLEAKLTPFDCEPLADRLVRGVSCVPIHDVPARWPIRTRSTGA
jgi:hypothetical protein